MTDPIMEGYDVLLPHEFMVRHNSKPAVLGEKEPDILSDFDSELDEIREELHGEVFDKTQLLDTKLCDDIPHLLRQRQTARSGSSSMLPPTPEHERVLQPGYKNDCD